MTLRAPIGVINTGGANVYATKFSTVESCENEIRGTFWGFTHILQAPLLDNGLVQPAQYTTGRGGTHLRPYLSTITDS